MQQYMKVSIQFEGGKYKLDKLPREKITKYWHLESCLLGKHACHLQMFAPNYIPGRLGWVIL